MEIEYFTLYDKRDFGDMIRDKKFILDYLGWVSILTGVLMGSGYSQRK